MAETLTKHTPGPWWHKDYSVGAGDGGSTRTICHTALNAKQRKRPDAEPNARLISAAPDLLEACKALFDAIERTPCHCDEAYTGRGLTDPSCIRCGMDVTTGEMDAARAAIAKATGAL